ncbi:MAG: hypothetical protein EZS28_041225 [Streblomastix strix]|uniref:Uncharacterized protein n=1 Tax=Streblomastix strix TaxID=222440 RepID=A0A5J4TZ55_9EUKA|nr:MAG: hypothetical protein EZS28_041225 [Streblomastix strix]
MQKEEQRKEGTEGGNTNRRSEIQILLEETCPSFYPEFTPIFQQNTTDQVNDALDDLDNVAADKKSIKEYKNAFQYAQIKVELDAMIRLIK